MQKAITSEKYQALLSWLKKERKSRKLSMRDLAAIIDMPHQFIGKIESAERRLDVYEYVVYCEAMGVDPAEGLKILK